MAWNPCSLCPGITIHFAVEWLFSLRGIRRQAEHEGMTGLGSLAGGGTPPAGYFALVFDKPFACGNRLQREKSLAVHR
jgi:hypothetical protein